MEEFYLQTPEEGFINITDQVKQIVLRSAAANGLCQVFVPHTTAGITINQNTDLDVKDDMLLAVEDMVPTLEYNHAEQNSPAHVKSSLMGCSVTIPVARHELVLGPWQGIYFCEFNGPRERKVVVQVVGCV